MERALPEVEATYASEERRDLHRARREAKVAPPFTPSAAAG